MPVTPTGSFGLALDAARDIIAASAKFQEMVGAANATAAKAYVYAAARSMKDIVAPRPFALVFLEELVLRYGGFASGKIFVLFERDIPEAYRSDLQDSYYDYMNYVDQILYEVMELADPQKVEAGSAGYLFIKDKGGISCELQPSRSDVTDSVSFMRSGWMFDFGLELN